MDSMYQVIINKAVILTTTCLFHLVTVTHRDTKRYVGLGVDPELKRKWIQMSRSYDHNNDGYLTIHDFEIFKDNLEMLVGMNEYCEELPELMSKKNFQIGKDQSLTIQHGVNILEKRYNKNTLALAVREYREDVFDCFEQNKKDFMNFEEFKNVMKALGISNEDDIQKSFNAIDKNNDKKIKRNEYIAAYYSYVLDPKVKLEDLPLFGSDKK